MGLYINQLADMLDDEYLPAKGKAALLIKAGAKEIFPPIAFQPNLVCVVENEIFDAAAYCDCKRELHEFSNPSDYRRKRWLIVPDAATLAH